MTKARSAGFHANALPWLALVGIVSILAALTATWHPVAPLLVALASLAVAIALFAPKSFVALTLFSMFFVRTLEVRIGSTAVGYLDEGAVLLAAAAFSAKRYLSQGDLRRLPGLGAFMAFLAVGALSSIANVVPPSIALQGAFLLGKGILFGWAVAQVSWTQKDVARIVAAAGWFGVALVAAMTASALAPTTWNAIVLGGFPVQYRYGLPVPLGLFVHPGYLGTTMALLAIGALTYWVCVARTWRPLALAIACTLGVVVTLRRKVLIASIAGAGLASIIRSRGKALVPIALAALAAVAAFWRAFLNILVYTGDEYLANPDRVARIRLTIDAPRVAWEYFPLGAGFGRFGSAVARANYSPEYVRLGYLDIWGLGWSDENGKFLTDTFWPAVIGESGFIGLACYVAALVAIIRYFLQCWRRSDTWTRWLGLMGIGWSAELLVESGAGPIFMAAPTYGLLFGLAGLLVAMESRERSVITGRVPEPIHHSSRVEG